ncbi:hypothetical protein CHELA20_10840 [Hyphomicrobiales bacterium]|nr:hypothetical protein CHELA20_10840 [Hyphomicrobiales bacterium]CAH1693934.1 hypothetical protein CHELA41_51071 [Hyphomicrobiales bacterium]
MYQSASAEADRNLAILIGPLRDSGRVWGMRRVSWVIATNAEASKNWFWRGRHIGALGHHHRAASATGG